MRTTRKLVPVASTPAFTRYATYAVPPSGCTSNALTVASVAAYGAFAADSNSAFVRFLDHVAVAADASR